VPANGKYQVDGKDVSSLDGLMIALQELQSSTPDRLSVVINGDQAASIQQLVDVMSVLKKLHIEAMTISAKKTNG
jgi:biopolymer transport protein ExbD